MACIRCGDPSAIFRCARCESIERERQEDAERAERAHEEQLEQLRENAQRAEQAAYARINPGDYDCPACLYRTLKYRATRCPMCRADVGSGYWIGVDTRARAAKEEWERGAPARAAKAAAEAAAEAARVAEATRVANEHKAREHRNKIRGIFFRFYYGYLWPPLCTIFALLLGAGPNGLVAGLHRWDNYLMCVPFLNWLLIVLLLCFGHEGRLFVVGGLALTGLAGLLIGYGTWKPE